jgi:1-deoxy-D-xylulose-5-phosphate reductoisomerase
VAVELFLQGAVKFTDIARLVEQVLREHQTIFDPTLDDIINTDRWAREKAFQFFNKSI